MKSKQRFIAFALFLSCSIACFVFFQFFYQYHLVHRLDLQLFLYSREYILSYFNHPAWLASLSGDFLTQFFYFETGGALVLSLLVALLGILFFRALSGVVLLLQNNGQQNKLLWFGICLFVSCGIMGWEWLRNCGMDYKLSSTIALIGGVALFLPYKYIPFTYRYVAGVILLCLTYWLFGYGIWVLLFFILFYELTAHRYVLAAVCLAAAIAFPFFLRQHYCLTVKQAIQYPSTSWWGKPDMKIEKWLMMDVIGFNGGWNAVAHLSEQNQLQSGISAYFYNLSHAMRGELPDKLLSHYQPGPLGLLFQLNAQTPYLAIWSSNEAWFQLGDMTMAEHSALLGMIFSPDHRSARMVKRLAEINMVNGDSAATLKYLRMLQNTWLYKKWADQRIPGHESLSVKEWLQRKQALTAKTDTLRDAVNPVISLRTLLDSNRDNHLALDYLLCYDLLTKDIRSFMADYDKYKLPGREDAGRLYGEALLIGLTQCKATIEQVKSYLMPPDLFAEFADYTTLYQKNDLNRASLFNRYGKTYWFYYHFATFK